MFLRSSVFYAILAFILSNIIIGFLLPELACMDGWNSQSIGKSGACSHHGGVNYAPVAIGFILSLFFSFWTWKKTKKYEKQLKDPENKIINSTEKTSINALFYLNKALCLLWNFLVKLITHAGFSKVFEKWPIITVIVSLFAITLFIPLMAAIFILGVIAFMNGANADTKYLVPEL